MVPKLNYTIDLKVRKQCEDASIVQQSKSNFGSHPQNYPVQRSYSVGIIVQVDGKTTP